MKTPVWAARLLQFIFAMAILLLTGFLVPGWNCSLVRPLVGLVGLFWFLFGALSYSFSWAFPRRGGGGVYSPTSQRHTWLAFCFGIMALGSVCLLAFIGYFPLVIKGCEGLYR